MLRNLCHVLNKGFWHFIAKINKPESASLQNSQADVIQTFVEPLHIELPETALLETNVKESLPTKNEVDSKTVLGRRLLIGDFDEGPDGSKIITAKAFIDTRVAEDLSFDALGYTGIVDNKIVAQVRTILKKHIELTSENYVAWAGIKKKTIQNFRVYSTPITDGENPNPHHCDFDRSDHRTRATARSLAFELMFYANKDKIYIPVEH